MIKNSTSKNKTANVLNLIREHSNLIRNMINMTINNQGFVSSNQISYPIQNIFNYIINAFNNN